MTAKAFDALVTDAYLRQSLVTVRSLGRRELAVAALEAFSPVPAFSSRWCLGGFVCPAPAGTDDYLGCLEEVLEHTRAQVLIPMSDGTIALLRRHRARVEQRVRIALAKEPALAIAVNKERTLAIAGRLGVAIPPGLVVRAESQVPAAVRDIGLPAVIKPSESWVGDEHRAVRLDPRLATTAEEARSAVADIARFGGVALYQEFIHGRRESIHLLYARGRIHTRVAQWAKRMRPPWGGESVLRQSIAVPADIGAQAERLVREIDLEGYSEVEFLRDRGGVPYLMELNPRLSASVEIAVRSGVDFPYLFYQWARGGPIDTVDGYRVGSWMRYLQGDLWTTIAALRQHGRPGVTPPIQAILNFGLAFLRPTGYDCADWRDPLPAVKAVADMARFSARRFRG